MLDAAPWTFFGVPRLRSLDALSTQVAFLGVPDDSGTPQPGNPTGQREGPTAARQGSRELFAYSASPDRDDGADGWYDVEEDRDHLTGVTMADLGDVLIQGGDTAGNHARITGCATAVCEAGSTLVAVGGDHSVSHP